MRLIIISIFVSLYLCQVKAGDIKSLDPIKILPIEVVYKILIDSGLKLYNIVPLSQINQAWQEVLEENESFWQLMYIKRISHSKKINLKLSYKDNVKFIHQTIFLCSLFSLNDLIVPQKYCLIENYNGKPINYETHTKKLLSYLYVNPKVLFSLFDTHTFEIINLSKEKDVLLIIPVGQEGINISKTALGFDWHELYPNIIWVISCYQDSKLKPYSNYGEIVDIATKDPQGSGNCTATLATFAVYLRWLRPDLTAKEIRELLIKTADTTEETKIMIPNGGILNKEKALKALKELNGKPSNAL